ncbi:hypothetical protein MKZ38_006758 [Zalerion maritima]|uniref:Uncharacterized protein n=1 Tax=Zalerion maritima TaxID=339359 RepID=A0AAD5RJQ3_9PEZI|nr:hypothetical protein MKZ38_006758 [Zalerion maritima]
MADDRKSDDSLEKELAYEDIAIQAGESSKLRREKKKEQKAKEEEDKQVQMKEAMFQAGESSRARRKRQN